MATAEEVQLHYDSEQELFASFLDRIYMVYSCGVWDQARSLEEAQIAKLGRMSAFAGVGPGSRFLDVGCGWGGMCRYGVEVLGSESATGITLSRQQHAFVEGQGISGVRVRLQDWRDFCGQTDPYDAIVSIGAFEHFASRIDRREGRHREIYRAFFRFCQQASKPGARLGLQTIVTAKRPDSAESIRDSRFLLNEIFPGSALPTADDIQASASDIYQVLEWRSIGLDYARTLDAWRQRLHRNETYLRRKFGHQVFDHYDAYFLAARRNFAEGYTDLAQVSLRRLKPSCHDANKTPKD